jgi:predicted nucleotidyltransferase
MQNKTYPLISKSLTQINKDILATLAYFDLFNYPLTRAEVYLFLKNKYETDEFDEALICLLNNGIIHLFDRFYTLQDDHYLVVRRNEGNQKAAELIKTAEKVGRLLIKFPFVRGIGISGSLSKNFADDDSDIDLFIITAKNRLWIARTLMHCFKKLTFLANKEHYFCMNYYVDEQQQEIVEKSIYTAIEIATLIPLQGDTVFQSFYTENSWTRLYLPNKTMRVASAQPVKNPLVKAIFEMALNNNVGDAIDNLLMKITASRWLKKTQLKKRNIKGLILGMAAGKHFAKPDPANFQNKLINSYEHKVAQLLRAYEQTTVH